MYRISVSGLVWNRPNSQPFCIQMSVDLCAFICVILFELHTEIFIDEPIVVFLIFSKMVRENIRDVNIIHLFCWSEKKNPKSRGCALFCQTNYLRDYIKSFSYNVDLSWLLKKNIVIEGGGGG